VVLAIGGGLLGLLVARFALQGLLTLAPVAMTNVPFRDLGNVSIDVPVFLSTALAALMAGTIAGIVPALNILPAQPADVLRDAGSRSGTARRGRALKNGLIALEVGLAVIVVSGAGLLVASVQRALRVHPGLDPAGVVAVDLALPQADDFGPAERVTFCEELGRSVGGLPGVASVSAVSHVPLTGANARRVFVIPEDGDPGAAERPGAAYGVVCPDYFRTMGIPLLRGRDFNQRDRRTSARVAIVNEALVTRWFGSRNPVGRQILLGGPGGAPTTVIGVVGNVRHNGLTQLPEPYLYTPYQQLSWARMTVMVRGSGNQIVPAATVRPALRQLFPGEPIGEFRAMTDVAERSVGHLKFPMTLFSVFAGLALALSALGCFGIANQTVVQRRRELGIRSALGASASRTYRLVFRQAMVPVAVGVVAGLAGASLFNRLLRGLLFGITPGNPLPLVFGAAALAVVTGLACLPPARRATRLDPSTVLRDD
jgi:putative ABC transport system permease protein